MNAPLRILIVEDSLDDAELLIIERVTASKNIGSGSILLPELTASIK